MKPKINLLISAFLTAVVFYSCSKGDSQENTKEDDKKLPLVKVWQVESSVFSENFKVSGVIKPYAEAKISSEQGGLIASLSKDKGSPVYRGEIVARIKKDIEYANYDHAEAQVNLARINYEKQKQLWEDNATTELQYLTAEWQYKAAERQLDILKQSLKTGFVRSPISGVVSEKYMNKGEMSSPGMPIFYIIDVARVKVSAGVPEMYLPKIKKGQSVMVNIDVLPGVEFEGKISYISPSLQGTSRSLEVEVIIPNRDRILKPGMNASLVISESSEERSVVIEQDKVIDYGDEQYTFILQGDISKKVVLKLGGRVGNKVQVLSGLNPGDNLIIEGFQSLKDGDKVQVVQ